MKLSKINNGFEVDYFWLDIYSIFMQLDSPILRPIPAGNSRKVLMFYWCVALALFCFMAGLFV